MEYQLHKSAWKRTIEHLLGERLVNASRENKDVAVLCLRVPRENHMTQLGMNVIDALDQVTGPDAYIMQIPSEKTSYVILYGGTTQQAAQIADHVKQAVPEQRRPETASMKCQPQPSFRASRPEANRVYDTLKARVEAAMEPRFPQEEAALEYEFA